MSFLSTYCKQIEAIGLLFVVSAAVFQFRADAQRRVVVETEIYRVAEEVEYNRIHVARLFRCTKNNDCEEFDFSHTMVESGVIGGYEFGSPEDRLRNSRLLLFGIGSVLIVVGKFCDKPKLKEKAKMKYPNDLN